MEVVKGLVQDRPVVIFSKTSCPVSHSMRQLISGFGANPTVYEIDQMPNGREIERVLQMMGRRPSVPSIFIGGNFVGGPNDVITLQEMEEATEDSFGLSTAGLLGQLIFHDFAFSKMKDKKAVHSFFQSAYTQYEAKRESVLAP
uniref:Glutaredoxin domain-containing protein n=1 Tax=Chenopodium quinoa TaxID=63459 RepID=A0A803LYB0_CHEQI